MIPRDVLSHLRYLEIYTSRKFRTLRVGDFTSQLHGSGVEFDRHRPYQVGDDVRSIDWSVTARMGAPYIRENQSERELNVVLVLDQSASMNLEAGEHSKREVVTYVSGALLFSALADQINCGMLSFNEGVLEYHPPRQRRKAGAWRLLEEMWAHRSQGTTRIGAAVGFLNLNLRKPSLIFLISDFLTGEDLRENALRQLAVRHDVILVIVEAVAERMLSKGAGFFRVRDMETGHRVIVQLSEKGRLEYAELMRARRRELQNLCYELGMDHVVLRAEAGYLDPLLNLFALRKRR